MKNIILVTLCLASLSVNSQIMTSNNDEKKIDTFKSLKTAENPLNNNPFDTIKRKHFLTFGHEKAGAICVNGLEKLEIAYSTRKSLTAVSQLHFYGPSKTEGRVFMVAEQEKGERSNVHFFETTFDLTWEEFPLHIGYTMGLDQVAKDPNTTYSGLAATLYFSDIESVHHIFHILRTGVSYLNLNEHLVNREGNDSTVSLHKKIEYSVFYQMQPFHFSKYTTLFSEGLLRLREGESFGELELGIRNEKILENLFGIGLRASWEDFKLNAIAGVIRFNISNPNPKHQ